MSRKVARELAFQGLYQLDVSKVKAEEVICNLLDGNNLSDSQYFKEILEGVEKELAILDEEIQKYSKKWKIDRLSKVDKAILRLACYEILYRQDVPNIVAINEAVELAKNFSDAQSSKFVNGILDEIRKDVEGK